METYLVSDSIQKKKYKDKEGERVGGHAVELLVGVSKKM